MLKPMNHYYCRSKPQHMDEVSSGMQEVVPRLSYQVGSGSFPEPCVCTLYV